MTVATPEADLKQRREGIRERIKGLIGADNPGLGGFQRVGRAVLLAHVIDRWLAEHVHDRDQLDDLINRFDEWARNPGPTRGSRTSRAALARVQGHLELPRHSRPSI